MTDYLENGKRVTADYCLALLIKLRSESVNKRRGKLCRGLLILHYAFVHRARQAVQTAF
ncbi:hypothetical protein PoB_003694900, partial [Plakobranchus ocellatus]